MSEFILTAEGVTNCSVYSRDAYPADLIPVSSPVNVLCTISTFTCIGLFTMYTPDYLPV